MSTRHIHPVGDGVVHDVSTDEPTCVCGPATRPVAQPDGSVDWLIVHASLDGRELGEAGAA